jgi:hypothetical protein
MGGTVSVAAGDTLDLFAGSSPLGGQPGLSTFSFLNGGNGFYGGGAASALTRNNAWVAIAGGGGGSGSDFSANGGDAGNPGVAGASGTTGLGGDGGSESLTTGQINATGTAGGGGAGGWSGSAGTGNSAGGGGANYNPNIATTSVTFNGTASSVATGKVEITYSSCPAPGQPGVISETNHTGTSAGISFAASTQAGIAVTGYKYSLDGGSASTLTTTGTSTLAATVTGLAPGGSYLLSVQPTYVVPNIQSESNRGQTVLGTARSFTLVIPMSPPTNLVATAGNGTATVTWNNPTDLNFSETVITAQPGGQTCTTTGTSCTFSNLTGGTSYTFTGVSNSVNTGASSPVSTVSNTVIPSGPASTNSNQATALSLTGSQVSLHAMIAVLLMLAGGLFVSLPKIKGRRD